MRQRQLEIKLQGLGGFERPRPDLEQYTTPANMAADIIYTAHALGDVQGKRVIDLGCGTGMFSIGCCLMGAEDVMGIDMDQGAIDTARENLEIAGCDVDLQCMTLEEVEGKWDTCIMNPPFGSQKKHADLPFLDKAMEVADIVYSLHNSETLDFLRRYIPGAGHRLDMEKNYKFQIPHTFEFHRKENADIAVTLLRTVRK